MRDWYDLQGSPAPQGVTYLPEKDMYNFSLYASNASRVKLVLFDEDVITPLKTIDLNPRRHKTQRLWHIRLRRKQLGEAIYYAYRVWGPEPHDTYTFHAFDPEKLLLDPFARNVYIPPGHSRDAASEPGDNAGKAPLGVLPPPKAFPTTLSTLPRIRDHRLIVYEMHVRQFTANANSGVSPENRGTYEGVIEKIPYLQKLGITAVELMPVQQWDPQEGSAWGYMTLNFFTPHRGYARDQSLYGPIKEFKKMVHALHEANIRVIMDVVYNHTTEGDTEGPCYSFRGIDNNSYYLAGDNGEDYANFSGTGNTLRSAHPQARLLIMESLRYWVTEMGIDGFRFDLGSIFALNSAGEYEPKFYSVIDQINHDPVLQDILIFTEPWDGDFDTQGYFLGKSFPGGNWKQWNDKGRTLFRQFIKGDRGKVGQLMTRMYGSADLFPGPESELRLSHTPSQSLNYISSHDGLTMYDLVSHTRPSQQSWDCGWDGVKKVPKSVMALRRKQVRNFITLLMLSNGTPMFRAGDEFLQTQYGLENPYNIDDKRVWLDWQRSKDFEEVSNFFSDIIDFRKAHPSIARGRYWQDDVIWYGAQGDKDLGEDSHALAYYLKGQNAFFDLDDDDLYVMINGYWEPVSFRIMEKGKWGVVIDTHKDGPEACIKKPSPVTTKALKVNARSIVVLLKQR